MVHTISAIDMAFVGYSGENFGAYRSIAYSVVPAAIRFGKYPSPKAIKTGPGGSQPFAGTPDEVADLVSTRAGCPGEKSVSDGAVMF